MNETDDIIDGIVNEITSLFNIKEESISVAVQQIISKYDIKKKDVVVEKDYDLKIYILEYLKIRRFEGLSEKTLSNYKIQLNKLYDFLKDKNVKNINTDDIRGFLMNYQEVKNVKASSLNNFIFCFNTFFDFLFNNEIIYKNPMIPIKTIKNKKRLQKIMSDEEVELLRLACKNTKEDLLLNLSLDTGMRVDELSKLNIDNIDIQNLKINVIGKGDKERIVYFTDKTKLIMKKYIQERKVHEEKESLFLSDKFPYQRLKNRALQVIMNNIKKQTGLCDKEYITIHGNRRWLATHLINKNVPLETVRNILGHESPSTTLLYSRLSQENIKNDYRRGI